jgi:transposase-like protein
MQSTFDAPHFHQEEAALAFVEAHLWPDGPVCPHCGETAKVGRLNGKTTRPGLCKCYTCKKPFTVRIGTVFEDSHTPFRYWLQAIYLLCACKKGISTRQLQRTLKCSMKTAWFLTHRIRLMMARKDDVPFFPPMGGPRKIIEADVTYVGRKAGTKVRPGPGHMNPVLALVERDGSVRSFHVPNVTAQTLGTIVLRNAMHSSYLATDEAPVFKAFGWRFADHGSVNHSADEYVRGAVYTNTVEGYFSILKRGVNGVYHHISEAHLSRYLAEFDFRYSHREKLGVDDETRAALALKGAKGKRLTYETTR